MKNESKRVQLNTAKRNKWAKNYDDEGWLHIALRNAQAKAVSLLDIKENDHFLDAGCGTGFAVGEAVKRIKGNGLFYGVDLSPVMIEKAKENFIGKDNFYFITANAESIPLYRDFFDIILCSNSFHHYLHSGKVLKEFYPLLKKGGKVYILDPTADKWYAKAADKIFQLIEPEHVKLYSTKEFRQLFTDAGFSYSTLGIGKGNDKIHMGKK